jgi:hypothetical protein
MRTWISSPRTAAVSLSPPPMNLLMVCFGFFFTSFVPGDALGGFLRFLQFFHGDARMKKMMVWSFC